MKIYLLPLLIFLLSLNLSAQQSDREKIEALKVSFITEQLDLTKEEAEKFWPVYNEFDKKNHAIRHQEMRSVRKEIKDNLSSMTDKKAEELLSKLNSIESRLHKNRLDFTTKIKTILSPKKVIKLKVAEEDFKRKMFNQFKSRRSGEKGNKH
ncbi:sensor of ECF-type sigma factor [Seonamhaeicola sediminis]|uniref:Sensor of ECF-type sigma factor n=1 Tax=Seonamhaeicola sediminis TaxID=2528206 RepID=A0A562YCY2_9FLAO|nr:sensor of ECF-type sigma factor [Seonamhaeicola sediminis]TWO31961.1 sensor of ECF-type sigma factor [Seonamhaeicola sediminis]